MRGVEVRGGSDQDQVTSPRLEEGHMILQRVQGPNSTRQDSPSYHHHPQLQSLPAAAPMIPSALLGARAPPTTFPLVYATIGHR